jgi:hypothetical protein
MQFKQPLPQPVLFNVAMPGLPSSGSLARCPGGRWLPPVAAATSRIN